MKKNIYLSLIAATLFLAGCSPEVGSKAWCDAMDKKPKGEWSANDAGEYTKSCVFRSDD